MAQRNREQTLDLSKNQFNTSIYDSEDPYNIHSPSTSSNSPGSSFHNSLLDVSDLDIPINHRKGTCNCVKYPIANYLSYYRLYGSHKVFTSKIINLLVPRNIHEALNDLNWKLAAME